MLPYRAEPDNFVVGQMELARPGSVDGALPDDEVVTTHAERAYPWLVVRVLLLWPRAERDEGRTYSLEEELSWAATPFRRARIVVAALGILIIPATFLLALRFVGAGWAWLAAAFVATSLLHVNFSQQCRPHIVVGATSTLAVVAAMRICRHGRLVDYLLALIACVLAIGSLHNGVMCLFPLAAAHLLRSRVQGTARIWPTFALPLLALAIGVIVFYPVSLSGPASSPANWSTIKQHLMTPELFDGTGFVKLFRGFAGYDPILLGLSVLGLVAIDARRLRRPPGQPPSVLASEALVALSYALPFLLVFGIYRNTLPRYAIPLLPFLALSAVVGVRGFVRLVSSYLGRVRTVAAIAGTLALVVPTAGAVKLVQLRSSPDSLVRTARWLAQNADPSQTLYLTPGFDLPMVQRVENLETDMGVLKFPWHMYQVSRRDEPWTEPSWDMPYVPYDDPEFVKALGIDPARAMRLLDADFLTFGLYWNDSEPRMWQRMRKGIRSIGDCVQYIAPLARAGRGRPLQYEDCFLRSVWNAKMVGPAIEIYRVRP